MSSPENEAQNAATSEIRKCLSLIIDRQSGTRLLEIATLDAINIRDGHLQLALATTREQAGTVEQLRPETEQALLSVHGISKVTVILTSHRPAAQPQTPPRHGHRPIGLANKGGPARALLPDVGAVVAVASGKGGVGKSTTAVNIAVGLAREGLRVGLLDADIHGPSLPKMLGISGAPEVRDGILQPVDAWGIKVISIGMLVDEKQAMIWRGPMVMGALGQLLGEVAWGELDVLIVDMPPGTGDAQLTLTQKISLSGAIIVSTPQDIALIDARRGIAMFEKTRVPVLGIVENMSYFCCPNCNHRTELFGHGGARQEAEQSGIPFLGEVPLLPDIRSSADAGAPIIASAPESEAAQAYAALAHTVAATLRNLLAKPRSANPG